MKIFLVFAASLLLLLPSSTKALVSPDTSKKDAPLLVKKQLGYLPLNYRQVSAWTLNGAPVAIQTYPLEGGAPRRQAKADIRGTSLLGTPFPTLYWLTCPDISKAISDLERRGYVSQLEDRLNAHPEEAARVLACHDHYAKERWLSLLEQDRTLLLKDDSSVQRMRVMLECSGVAGTNYKAQLQADGTFAASVKCLHAHYAHYRSKQDRAEKESFNPIGFWVHELLVQEFPDIIL